MTAQFKIMKNMSSGVNNADVFVTLHLKPRGIVYTINLSVYVYDKFAESFMFINGHEDLHDSAKFVKS
jgi:hypothetical protein